MLLFSHNALLPNPSILTPTYQQSWLERSWWEVACHRDLFVYHTGRVLCGCSCVCGTGYSPISLVWSTVRVGSPFVCLVSWLEDSYKQALQMFSDQYFTT